MILAVLLGAVSLGNVGGPVVSEAAVEWVSACVVAGAETQAPVAEGLPEDLPMVLLRRPIELDGFWHWLMLDNSDQRVYIVREAGYFGMRVVYGPLAIDERCEFPMQFAAAN